MSTERTVVRRRPPVKVAEAAPELAALGLEQLRAYRAALSAEEEKVSYWRRLLHGRIDLLQARSASHGTLSFSELVRVLGDTGNGGARRALLVVPAPVQLPDLPELDELTELWAVDPQDDDEVTRLVDRLRAQEARLSEYRLALHERIDAASGELITRYRAHPQAALALLPER